MSLKYGIGHDQSSMTHFKNHTFTNPHHMAKRGSSIHNPHKVAASFSNLPRTEERPHVSIKVANTDFWALLDTGASISLVDKHAIAHITQFINLKLQNQKLFVQDCHSNVQQTHGNVTITFDVLSANGGGTQVKQATAMFHIADNLSSSFLLGCDILRLLGCKIDMEKDTVSFKQREAHIFLNNRHPLFVAAAAASASEASMDAELSNFVAKYTFAASPTEDKIINPGDQATFIAKLETDENLQLKPGALMLVQSDGLNQQEPTAVTETTFANVRDGNSISITLANKSMNVAELEANMPIPGLIVQSMAAYHKPVEINQDDIIIMSNISTTVKQAEEADPTFKESMAKVAAASAIMADQPTSKQFVTDDVLFNNMRETYIHACNALRKTGKPFPGRREKPKKPCSKETEIKLLEQLDLSGCDKDQRDRYRRLVLDNYDVFSVDRYDLGHADHYEHVIEPVEEGMNPPFVKQFPIAVRDEDLLREFATTLTQRKVLIPKFSPGNSPVFMVRKANSQPRFVQDLRQQNSLTKPDRYQISDIRESLNLAARRKPKIMSNLDLSGSFWQLSLAEESRPWSAFTLPFMATQFVWSRTPMGARGSTASFAKFLHMVFRNCPEVITYVDDLITMAQSHDEMIANLEKIFAILRLNNLKLNLKKCKFGVRELDWLGFTINNEGIKPEMSKVQKCRELQPPKSAKEIESLLPFMAFNAQCLEKFQIIAGPLTDLTRKDSKWKSLKNGPLPEEALNAFYMLKAMLLERPLVYWPNTSLPFQMFTDAAVGTQDKPGGISAVLTQVIDGVTRPIGYFSRRLRDSENKYNSFNAELLAIHAGLQHWRPLLVGAQLTVFTDHKPVLTHLTRRAQNTMDAIAHKIINFDAKIQHLMGSENTIADYLSRHTRRNSESDAIEDELPKPPTQLALPTPQGKRKRQAGTTAQVPSRQRRKSADARSQTSSADAEEEQQRQKQNNQNRQIYIQGKRKVTDNLGNGDMPLESVTRQALLAKEHMALGLVGSKQRLGARGVSAAGVIDLSSKQFWIQNQLEDPVVQALIKFVTTGQRPPMDSKQNEWLNIEVREMGHKVAMDNGLLYYFGTYRKSPSSKKLFVPKNLVTPVIADAHCAATAGHWATETTVGNLMTTYFWPTMAADVQSFIEKCPTCFKVNDPNAIKTRSHMKALEVPPRQGYRVHVDLVGPLHNTVTNHKYCLTIVDALTRWTVLVPIESKEAEEVAKAIVNNWILKIGNIEYLVSDQGSEFVNKTLTAIAKFMKTTLINTAAYSPKSNGAAERIHRSLGRFLTIYCNDIGSDWIEWLPALQFSLNTKCHASTGNSPWFLMYGRYPQFPWRNEFRQTVHYGEDEATRRMQLIQYAMDMVKERDKEARAAFQRAYNKKCKNRQFKLNDAVLVHYPSSVVKGRVNRKFMPQWHGIYYVIKILGTNTYEVRKEGCRKTKVSADRMKLYNEFLHMDDPVVKIDPQDKEMEEDENPDPTDNQQQ